MPEWGLSMGSWCIIVTDTISIRKDNQSINNTASHRKNNCSPGWLGLPKNPVPTTSFIYFQAFLFHIDFKSQLHPNLTPSPRRGPRLPRAVKYEFLISSPLLQCSSLLLPHLAGSQSHTTVWIQMVQTWKVFHQRHEEEFWAIKDCPEGLVMTFFYLRDVLYRCPLGLIFHRASPGFL